MGYDAEENVRMMLGDPRKAIVAMTLPVAIAMIVQNLNNLIDAAWVSGLGVAELAAVGVLWPFFFTIIGIGNGIGVGASQAIARRIGSGDREGADRVAAQAFVMSIVASAALVVVFYFFSEELFIIGGAGEYIDECMAYGFPMGMSSPIIVIGSLLAALLRAEGAAKRAMTINILGSVMNMVLDPIFIYGFDLGLFGAAVATIIAMASSVVVGLYWYMGSRSTFVRIPLAGFRFDRALDWDILRVGVPAAFEMFFLSVSALVTNLIILMVDPVDGIAIYTTAWRLLDMLMIPMMAMGFAVVPICAAAYGARKEQKAAETFRIANVMGLKAMVVVSLVTFVFARYMIIPFTYVGETAALAEPMVEFVRIGCVFLPFITFSYLTAGLFQSLGMGTRSLATTAILNILRIPFCYVGALMGSLTAIWFAVALSEIVGAVIIGAWGLLLYRALKREEVPYRGDLMSADGDIDSNKP